MEKQQDRIRIKDIAQMAGVSVGTVDRVLHSRSGVSESSRIKVEEILKKLNYQPNMYASALASNKKYRFAYLLPSHNEGDYWKDVERGMQQAITRFSDFNVSLSDYDYDQYESGAFIESGMRILDAQPDGVILSPTVEEETEQFVNLLREAGIPYVFIDSNIARLEPLAFYGPACPAERILCRPHVASAGKRRTGDCHLPSDKRRTSGFEPAAPS